VNFYENFTDIVNLSIMQTNKVDQLLTPSKKEFGLKTILDYNLDNVRIMQKQVDILTSYNLPGFGVYFYWFNINTVTHSNQIMEKVINNFFNGALEMADIKIFFIWANESWTNNKAFASTDNEIINNYNDESIELFADKVIEYFTHDIYLKINNKPVLFILHPWEIPEDKMQVIFDILHSKCLDSNFDGIHIVVNSMIKSYDNITGYSHNFNYKNNVGTFWDSTKNQIYLDYAKYQTSDIVFKNNMIQTVSFDFDNTARLIKTNKTKFSTICINNSLFNKINFLTKCISKYENVDPDSELNQIMLFNAWNEWGERMAIEPSNEYGYFYLNLINDYLYEYV
jgi:hypothetical protein